MNILLSDLLSQAEQVLKESNDIIEQLSRVYDTSQIKKLNQRYKGLELKAIHAKRLIAIWNDYQELKEIAQNIAIDSELIDVESRLKAAYAAFQETLIEYTPELSGNAIVEFKPGTGGDEAALFAGDLWRMYSRYAIFKGWKWEVINFQVSESGGIKEASARIIHDDALKMMQLEGGVHRVQRVPETESYGRIHTSTAVVCVLPEEEDEDIHIDKKDLQIEKCRSSGPGGQSVNTSDTAITLLHIPTGIRVSQQDERSSRQNLEKAMQILKERLMKRKKETDAQERNTVRSNQAGGRNRADKIRTYNYPQNRITDHRYHIASYKLDRILDGQEELEKFLFEIQAAHIANPDSDQVKK